MERAVVDEKRLRGKRKIEHVDAIWRGTLAESSLFRESLSVASVPAEENERECDRAHESIDNKSDGWWYAIKQ